MIKIIKFLFIEIALILTLLIILPALFIKEKVDVNIEGGKPILSLQSGKFYTQKISNPTKSLNSISLQLKNPQIKDNSLIYIEIMDEVGEIQRDFSIYGANIGDPSWIKLKFSPLSDPEIFIKVSSECPDDKSLYLYASEDNIFDLKTTYQLPDFLTRLQQNIDYQIQLISSRSPRHNFFYISALIILNIYFFKKLNEI